MRTEAVVIVAIYNVVGLYLCMRVPFHEGVPFHRVRCTLPGDLVPWGTKSPDDLVPRGIKLLGVPNPRDTAPRTNYFCLLTVQQKLNL